MHKNINNLVAITILILAFINNSEVAANTDSQSHCNDKIRDLVMDSCRAISQSYNRQRHHELSVPSASIIVKRENEVEPDYDVQFLGEKDHQSIIENHHNMFLVRHRSYPGIHLILNHRTAKMLKEFDSDYKMHPYPTRSYNYKNVDGALKKELIRGKRNTHSVIREKIAVCCASEISCKVALCLARSRL